MRLAYWRERLRGIASWKSFAEQPVPVVAKFEDELGIFSGESSRTVSVAGRNCKRNFRE